MMILEQTVIQLRHTTTWFASFLFYRQHFVRVYPIANESCAVFSTIESIRLYDL